MIKKSDIVIIKMFSVELDMIYNVLAL